MDLASCVTALEGTIHLLTELADQLEQRTRERDAARAEGSALRAQLDRATEQLQAQHETIARLEELVKRRANPPAAAPPAAVAARTRTPPPATLARPVPAAPAPRREALVIDDTQPCTPAPPTPAAAAAAVPQSKRPRSPEATPEQLAKRSAVAGTGTGALAPVPARTTAAPPPAPAAASAPPRPAASAGVTKASPGKRRELQGAWKTAADRLTKLLEPHTADREQRDECVLSVLHLIADLASIERTRALKNVIGVLQDSAGAPAVIGQLLSGELPIADFVKQAAAGPRRQEAAPSRPVISVAASQSTFALPENVAALRQDFYNQTRGIDYEQSTQFEPTS